MKPIPVPRSKLTGGGEKGGGGRERESIQGLWEGSSLLKAASLGGERTGGIGDWRGFFFCVCNFFIFIFVSHPPKKIKNKIKK